MTKDLTSVESVHIMKDALNEIKTISPDFSPTKKQTVGNKPHILSLVLGTIFVVFLALFVTGFGYQPWWVFAIVLILGLGITFPACFNQYWSVDKKQITITSYSNNDFKKLAQLFNLTSKDQTIINLSNVQEAAIVYRKIVRLSPFNFNPDHLLLGITTKDGKEIDLDLGNIDYQGLATITLYLSEAGAKVDDQQGILRLLSENQNLFKHFHKKWASL